jgi:peptide/nickel transport system permease protein
MKTEAEILPVTRKPQSQSQVWNVFKGLVRNKKALTGLILFSIFVLIAIFAPLIAPYDPQAAKFDPLLKPTDKHWFGTSNTGIDLFSQFIYGARTTITIGLGAGIFSTIIGLIVGLTSGYRGGWVDSILSFIMNIFLVLPGLALLIVIESLVKNTTPYVNGLIIALTGWAWGARVFRAQTLTLASRDFVIAAKLTGASDLRIMLTEISPNMLSVIAANIMYATLGAILAESGLAYLGLESINATSWGTMLYWAGNAGAMLTGAWWWFIPPGLGIGLVGLSLVLMNYGIDQFTNPRLRQKVRRKGHGRQ